MFGQKLTLNLNRNWVLTSVIYGFFFGGGSLQPVGKKAQRLDGRANVLAYPSNVILVFSV